MSVVYLKPDKYMVLANCNDIKDEECEAMYAYVLSRKMVRAILIVDIYLISKEMIRNFTKN